MNQHIEIRYKPDLYPDLDYWMIWFNLNYKEYREKAPSFLKSDNYWTWCIKDKFKKNGYDFDWDKS